MTGDTTPQDPMAILTAAIERVSDVLAEPLACLVKRDLTQFQIALDGPFGAYASPGAVEEMLSAAKHVLSLPEGAAGLLCSSPVVQPTDQDGSLRSGPSAPGPQWAVLRPDDHNIYKAESSARRVLLFLGEAGEEDYRLYEVREVAGG